MPRFALIVLVILAAVVGQISAQDAPLEVVATTSLIADVAQNVGGDLVNVTPLLPPNTDTHAYEPTPNDIVRVAEADMLLVNGAGYEAFLVGLLDNAGGTLAPLVVSNGVEILAFGGEHEDEDAPDVLGILGDDTTCEAESEHDEEAHEDEHAHGICDPHVWMNPRSVIVWARNIADAFSAADPANADTYRTNAEAYVAQLESLDDELREILSVVPESRRVLVTNHDFMAYFARAYRFEVVATVLPGMSTGTEPNPQELTTLIARLEAAQVPAIFAEVSANSQLANIVAQEAGVIVVSSLYSESLSALDAPASTYIDFMRYNAQTIADALAG